MNEQEEFEFRHRLELERSGMSHKFSSESEMPRRESKSGDFMEGIKSSFAKIPLGITQRMMEITGNPKAGYLAQLERNRRVREQGEDLVLGDKSLTRSAGEFLGELAVPLGIGAAAGPTLPAAAVTGIISGLSRPSISPEETVSNAATEGLFALGTGAATRAFMPRPKIEPEHFASLRAGRKAGFKYTGGQISQNPIVQRAEAHGMWNPFTKWHLQPIVNEQDNAFVRKVMTDIGVPNNKVPKNPALDAKVLSGIRDELGKRFDAIFPDNQTIDLSLSARTGLWKQMHKSSQATMLSEEKALVLDLVKEVKRVSAQGPLKAPIVQDLLELTDEVAGRLESNGMKKGSEAVKSVYKELLKTINSPDDYVKVRADYGRLKTIEDLLRRSKGIGEGIPDKTKLAQAIEKNMPGGVLYGRSSMADTARGGRQTAMVGALPERSTGLPIPSDIPNLMTYFRYNTPFAKFGMLNPVARDQIEFMLKYLPGTSLRKSTEQAMLSE